MSALITSSCFFLFHVFFRCVITQRVTQPPSNGLSSISSHLAPNPTAPSTNHTPPSIHPAAASMVSSQSCPVSINSSAEVSIPQSTSQPVSVTSNPQSEVDLALHILNSGSSLHSESARVMPQPSHALSPLSVNNLLQDSSSLQVTLVLVCCYTAVSTRECGMIMR